MHFYVVSPWQECYFCEFLKKFFKNKLKARGWAVEKEKSVRKLEEALGDREEVVSRSATVTV